MHSLSFIVFLPLLYAGWYCQVLDAIESLFLRFDSTHCLCFALPYKVGCVPGCRWSSRAHDGPLGGHGLRLAQPLAARVSALSLLLVKKNTQRLELMPGITWMLRALTEHFGSNRSRLPKHTEFHFMSRTSFLSSLLCLRLGWSLSPVPFPSLAAGRFPSGTRTTRRPCSSCTSAAAS